MGSSGIAEHSPKMVFESDKFPPPDTLEQIVELQPIAPYGEDISSEQLCFILGLTVNKQVVEHGLPLKSDAGNLDFSGKTTYWDSSHTFHEQDVKEFFSDILNAFPDITVIQFENGFAGKCRENDVFFASDGDILIGVGGETDKVNEKITTWNNGQRENIYEFCPFGFRFSKQHWGKHANGTPQELRKIVGMEQFPFEKLRYQQIPQEQYGISTQFETHDQFAQACIKKAIGILDRHICRGLKIVDMDTLEIIGETTKDIRDVKSYGKHIRDVCISKERSFIGISIPSHGIGRDDGFWQTPAAPRYPPEEWKNKAYGLLPIT